MATVSSKDVDMLLELTPEKITRSVVMNLIAYKQGKGQKYTCQDIAIVPAGKYQRNQKPIETTLGRLILNKLLFEKFYGLLGYVNEPLTKDKINGIDNILANALLNDKITTEDYIDYLDKFEWFGFSFAVIICNGFTYNTLSVNPRVRKRKDEMLKQYSSEIASGDPVIAVKMEKELLSIAKEELKDDPGMSVYNSGSKSKFDNQYKSMFVMKGVMQDNAEGKFVVSTSSLSDGVPIEDHHIYGDFLVTSAYNKGVGTQIGGYMTKKFFAAFQTLVLDEPGTNCGSKGYLELTVDKFLTGLIMYRYVIEGSKLTLLTDSNISKYIGKTIKMRSPCFCTSDKICNICAGDLYYKLGIKNLGLTAQRISSSVLSSYMKGFHDSTTKLYDVSPEDVFI